MQSSGLAVPVHPSQTHLCIMVQIIIMVQMLLLCNIICQRDRRARQSHWYCQMALIPFLLSLTGELKHRRKMYILAIWGDTLGLNT